MDERQHALDDAGGAESWRFDFATADCTLAGWVRYTRTARGLARYHAHVVRSGEALLAVVDDEVPLRASVGEVRTDGLWADHTCETAFDHWTVGLEAFALAVDDPADLYRTGRGDLVPLGLDLEWEAESEPVATSASPGSAGYEQACRVTGEVLVGPGVFEVDAFGWRGHDWGARPWWSVSDPWLAAVVEGDEWWLVDGVGGVASVVHGGSDAAPGVGAPAAIRLETEVGGDGFPTGGQVVAGDDTFDLHVVAVTPVAIGSALQPRALVRLHGRAGRFGIGWLTVPGPGPLSLGG